MKLWKDNKLTGEYEMSEQEIADRFLASKYGDFDRYPWLLGEALAAFIADREPDGLASWCGPADAAFVRVMNLVIDAREEAALFERRAARERRTDR